jgi:hypothetical protein
MTLAPGEAPHADAAEINTSPENFEQDFAEAQAWMRQIKYQPDFQAMQARTGMDPRDNESPRYWSAVYAYTQHDISRRRETGNESEATLRMQQLVGSAPHAAITSAYLNDRRIPPQSVDSALNSVSQYNDLIRGVAGQYRGLTVRTMTNSLNETINSSITSPRQQHLRNSAANTIRGLVRGAQKEMQQRQILEVAGYEVDETSVKEDVHGGMDYKVKRGDGHIVNVNSKSSGAKIRQINGNSESRFAYDFGKDVLLVNVLLEDESGNTFDLPPNILEQKAKLMYTAIESVPNTSRRTIGGVAVRASAS